MKHLLLMLDFDGTLSPIAKTPRKAALPVLTKRLLSRLSKNRDCTLVVISGRAIKDVSKKVGLKGIVYAGNHGMEVRGKKFSRTVKLPKGFRVTLNNIKRSLQNRLYGIKGVLIEDKGMTMTIHYRMVKPSFLRVVKSNFHWVLDPYVAQRKAVIRNGKMSYEVRPPVKWGKGETARWILDRSKRIFKEDVIPVYIGDDQTDEDAFRALKKEGYTAFVGEGNMQTSAKYVLKNTKEVGKFLKDLERIYERNTGK